MDLIDKLKALDNESKDLDVKEIICPYCKHKQMFVGKLFLNTLIICNKCEKVYIFEGDLKKCITMPSFSFFLDGKLIGSKNE